MSVLPSGPLDPTTDLPLRVALVGYGLAGRVFHAPVISAVPELSLAVVITGDADRADQLRRRYPDTAVAPSLQVLTERDAIDLVVVATPSHTHVPLVRTAIESGWAVVVDKPMATAGHQVAELAELARERGVLLTAFQNRRWDGDFRTVQSLVASGELGELLRLESRFERPRGPAGWRLDLGGDEGGGVLWDLGPHLIDQAVQLAGPVHSVFAQLLSRSGGRTDEDAFLALTHANGTRSHLAASWASAGTGLRFRVTGTEGTYLKFGEDPQEDALAAGLPIGADWGKDPEEGWGRIVSGRHSRPVRTVSGDYREFYRQVAAAVRGAAEAPVTPVEVLHTTLVIEAAQRSGRTGQVVAVPSSSLSAAQR